MDDMIADAIAIGKRNKEIIDLAFAWCQNIKLDRSLTGVGIVEQQTGLPIGGGTFTCDYARGPSPSGMQLEGIAFDFYQRNCVGCSYRKPNAVFKNLGTWAEGILEEQRKGAEAAKQIEEHREAERQQRHRNRRLSVGHPDALVQSILDLIERIDRKRPDQDAKVELVALARLHPDAFSDKLLQVLLIDARQCKLSALVEAACVVYELQQRPSLSDLMAIALSAVAEAWAGDLAIELVATHADSRSIDKVGGLFQEAVRLAAPHSIFHRGPEPVPGVLLRFYIVAPERTRELLTSELKHGDDWRRSSAARAAHYVIQQDLASIPQLLEALLDSLKFPEQSRHGPEQAPSDAAARVIAEILTVDPKLVDLAVERRWRGATSDYRKVIFQCYDKVSRGRLSKQLPRAVATIVARRALNCLIGVDDEDLARDAGDLLKLVFKYHGEAVEIPPDTIFGALAVLSATKDELEKEPVPSLGIEFFKQMAVRSRGDGSISHVIDALVAIAPLHPDSFWQALEQVWEQSADASTLRRALVAVVGRCARQYQALPRALPYLYTAMMGVDIASRARVVAAVSDIHWNDLAEVPETVAIGVLLALDDKYLAVVSAAVETIRNIDVPMDKKVAVVVRLLDIAASYAGDRRQSNLVREALHSALTLVDEAMNASIIYRYALSSIDCMPRYEAVDTLLRFPFRVLRAAPEWLQTAISVLFPDKDPHCRSIDNDDWERLLCAISEFPPEKLEPHVSMLVELATRALDEAGQHRWAWMIADVLSVHEFFVDASEVCDRVVNYIPDTIERRPLRLFAQMVAESQRYEMAIASNDSELRKQAASAWVAYIEQARLDDEENQDARSPFYPPFTSD